MHKKIILVLGPEVNIYAATEKVLFSIYFKNDYYKIFDN